MTTYDCMPECEVFAEPTVFVSNASLRKLIYNYHFRVMEIADQKLRKHEKTTWADLERITQLAELEIQREYLYSKFANIDIFEDIDGFIVKF